jgi:transposase
VQLNAVTQDSAATLPDATFACPDLTTFCRLDELGLLVTGQRLEPGRAVLACRVIDDDQWCRRCGCEGFARDTVTRRLAHEPLGWRPTVLVVTIRRYRCPGCGHVWRQDTSRAAEARAKLSRRALSWALEAIVCQHLTVARVAEGLAVSWNTANDAVLGEGRRVLISDPARFDGVRVIGVDEHVWRHTRRGDKYVTVIIDLTPVRDGTGPARLLDMVEGRSKAAFKAWLAERDKDWRDGVDVVAMDGFTGFKTATTEELPDATAVMDPFHVVRLAGDALDQCRRRVQQRLHGHRGHAEDPLYRARRTLHTGEGLLTDSRDIASSPCSQVMPTSRSKPPGGSTSGWSAPTASPTRRRAATSWSGSSRRSATASPARWSSSSPWVGPSNAEQLTSWPTSIAQAPATVRQKRSTGDSNISAEVPAR